MSKQDKQQFTSHNIEKQRQQYKPQQKKMVKIQDFYKKNVTYI